MPKKVYTILNLSTILEIYLTQYQKMSRTHGFMSRTPLLNKKTAFHRLFLHYKINSNAEWWLFFNGRYTKK
jgi:hypothetical protein